MGLVVHIVSARRATPLGQQGLLPDERIHRPFDAYYCVPCDAYDDVPCDAFGALCCFWAPCDAYFVCLVMHIWLPCDAYTMGALCCLYFGGLVMHIVSARRATPSGATRSSAR